MTSTTSLAAGELAPRLAARAIDVLVIVAFDLALGQAIGFGWSWLAIGTAFVLLYFAGLDALAGATLGKAALGLRVVGPDGGRPTLRQAIRREAFTLLGSIPLAGPLLAVISWIWIIRTIRASDARQGAHDRLAGGTRVIRAAGVDPVQAQVSVR